MYKLKTNSLKGHEESDFATQAEAEAHFQSLKDSGYYGVVGEYDHEIVSISPVFVDISPRQLRLVLLSMGLSEASVDAIINQLPSPQKEQAMIAWKYSTTFVRIAPMVAEIGAMLSLSSDNLDQIWIAGKDL